MNAGDGLLVDLNQLAFGHLLDEVWQTPRAAGATLGSGPLSMRRVHQHGASDRDALSLTARRVKPRSPTKDSVR